MNKSHSAVVLVGVALIAGFFLPWVSLGIFGGVSGFDIVWHGQGDYLSRLALLALPVMGGSLMAAGLNRSRAAASMGVLTGVGILGYVAVKIAWSLITGMGLGLWLVLGAAVAGIVIGAKAQQPKQ